MFSRIFLHTLCGIIVTFFLLASPGMAINLTTGDGDGDVNIGSYDQSATSGDITTTGNFTSCFFDPAGPLSGFDSIFDSHIYIGSGGGATFIYGSSDPTNFINVSTASATSEFTSMGLQFNLEQTVEKVWDPDTGERTGSVLRQTYTIYNPTENQMSFELIRYIDPDILGNTEDIAGLTPGHCNSLIVYQFDGADPGGATNPSSFVGLQAFSPDAVDCSFDIRPYDDLESAIDYQGWSALDRDISDYDSNGDDVLDTIGDWTYAIGHQFVMDPKQTFMYESRTFFGQGNPEVYQIPNNMLSDVQSNHGDPVGIVNDFQLTIHFNTSMDTNTEPNIEIVAQGAANSVVPSGGSWQSTVLENDTYVTPDIALTSGMAGMLHVNVSGAHNNMGIGMSPVVRAYQFTLDAIPPANPAINIFFMCNSALVSWEGYVAPEDIGEFRIYRETAPFSTVEGLTPIASVDKTVRAYETDSLEPDVTYYVAVIAVDAVGNIDPGVVPQEFLLTGFLCLDKNFYNLTDGNDEATITLNSAVLNTDPGTIQNVDVTAVSDSDTSGITITLTETDIDTAVFTTAASGTQLGFSLDASNDANNLIKVADGDTITITFTDSSMQSMIDKAVIDTSPPVTTFQSSGDFYVSEGNNYAPLSFTYSFSAEDAYSGIERIEYSVDGSSYSEFTEPFALESEGLHVISYRAMDTAGNWEEAKTISVNVDNTPPNPPADLAGEQVDLQINLTWTANSEADLHGYNVYRDGIKVNDALILSTNYSNTITSGKTYLYNVTAVDRVGNESNFSNVFTILAVGMAPVITYPVGGTAFVDTKVTVRGTSESGAVVEIFVNGISQGTTVANSTGYFSLSGVQISAGINSITAVATSTYGAVSPSSEVVTIPLDPRPQSPGGLTSNPGDTVITISWNVNQETDLAGYFIYRDNEILSYDILTTTTYTDTMLINGKEYSYTVTAADSNGSESLFTSTIDVSPVAGPGWEIP